MLHHSCVGRRQYYRWAMIRKGLVPWCLLSEKHKITSAAQVASTSSRSILEDAGINVINL